jgi:peroxiredoxin
LVGYEKVEAELEGLGVSVYAASVDTGDEAREVANDVSFAIGAGVTREQADAIGGWWDEGRGIVQPSQFVIRRDGTIIQSTYSDGPLGRLLAEDVIGLVKFLTKQ